MKPRTWVVLATASAVSIAAAWQGVAQTDALPSAAMRGMALPAKQVVLNAPVDGMLANIAVEEGQRVKAGDVLLKMDDRLQAAAVEAARLRAAADAEATRTRLELEEAKIMLERLIEAQAARAAQEWEIRRARLRQELAEAAVKAAAEARAVVQAELELETRRLALYTLTAPWDGVVVRVPVETGATLTRSDPVVRLVSLAQLEAEIYLPASLHASLLVGQTYTIIALAPVNRELRGSLAFADPVIDPASQAFRCVFTIDNADGALPAGFAVEIKLPAK